jgi:cytochrome P450
MSDRQVRDEVVTLFSAGYETTANAIVWAFYLLSQNPTVEEKLHRELDANLDGHKVLFSDLENLPYTELVIKETLRLYPPSWSMGLRSPLSPMEIGGYLINPGSLIWIVPYIMHRRSEYFKNPDEFIPERFEKESEKSLPRLAYMPFGGGHHICIGNAYATIEARIILAMIAKKYRLKVSSEFVLGIKPEITLNIRNGLRVLLEARKT